MKKPVLSLFTFIVASFFLTGLQSNLYFLPIPVPAFWFIIFTYYSIKKSFLFSLTSNFLHAILLISFSSISFSLLLILLNLISISFAMLRERFHINLIHITLGSGAGYFVFLLLNWAVHCFNRGLFHPEILQWIGTSIMTTLIAPSVIALIQIIDDKIQYERIDTLENLRI